MALTANTIYLAHPYGADVGADFARSQRWVRWIYRTHPDVVVLGVPTHA